MSRIAYVNGRYLPHADAAVHVEDRGYQFGDGVYEVCEIFGGQLVDATRHLARLSRSLSELRIHPPMSDAALRQIMREVVRRNRVRDGMIYIQVTRGVARRDHVFPGDDVAPAVVMTARSADFAKADRQAAEGVAVITVPENRWDRVDIKTVGLLPNVLAKQQAKEAGAREAWFVTPDGMVTEGGSTNAWIVTAEGRLVTRPATRGILRGITREVVCEVAASQGVPLEERSFSVAEAIAAREAFITAATTLVMPVVRIDGHPVGNGRPGPVTQALRSHFHEAAELVAV
jgi:D-alanine transaminase